jgi:hypothetical protein
LQSRSLLEREHGTLASGDDDRVEPCHVDVSGFARVLDECRQSWRGDEPHADQIICRVAARITRIAQGIWLTLTALRAEYLGVVLLVAEAQIWMGQFKDPSDS